MKWFANKRVRMAILIAAIVVMGGVALLSAYNRRALLTTEATRFSLNLLPKDHARQFGLELAAKLTKARRWEAALKIYEETLVLEPSNISLLNNIAYIAGEQGDFEKAKKYLDTAMQMGTRCAECLNNLGSIYYREKRYEDARRLYERASEMEAQYLDPRLNLAVLLEEQSDWAGALQWYKLSETLISDPELKKWVGLRTVWMGELAENSSRAIAGQK